MNMGIMGLVRNRVSTTFTLVKGAFNQRKPRKPQPLDRKVQSQRTEFRPKPAAISWQSETPHAPIGDVHWPTEHEGSEGSVAVSRGVDMHWSATQSDDLISTVTGASPSPPPRVPLPLRIILLRHGEPQPQAGTTASERIPEWKVPLTRRGIVQVLSQHLFQSHFNAAQHLS